MSSSYIEQGTLLGTDIQKVGNSIMSKVDITSKPSYFQVHESESLLQIQVFNFRYLNSGDSKLVEIDAITITMM